MAVLAPVLLLLTGFYTALVLAYSVGFRRMVSDSPPISTPDGDLPFVSVIVPARNEEASIGSCLEALTVSTYPSDRFEIIVVDDGSTDGTVERVQERRHSGQPALHLLSLDENTGHKSGALRAGIEKARGELIATTDADCVTSAGWLGAMVSCLAPGTAFVAGPVRYVPARTLLERLQSLEALGLAAISGGAVGAGRPHICNSANVLYRRDIYDRFHPRARGGAGEDEVLLQRVARESQYEVAFCAETAALVTARPESTLCDLIRQRRRWAATGARFPYASIKLLVVGIYLFYLVLLLSVVAAFWAPGLWPFIVAALALKLAVETSLLLPAARQFGRNTALWLLAPAQVLQIPYVVLTGLLGSLGPVRWKGRRIH